MILDMLITITRIREGTVMMLPLLIKLMVEFRNFLLQSSNISFSKSNLLKLSPCLHISFSDKNLYYASIWKTIKVSLWHSIYLRIHAAGTGKLSSGHAQTNFQCSSKISFSLKLLLQSRNLESFRSYITEKDEAHSCITLDFFFFSFSYL